MNCHDWLTPAHPTMHLCKLGVAAESVCEGRALLFRAVLSETQTVGPPCDDRAAPSEALPAQRSCQGPAGMATDWSPSPPLFSTRVHFSGDRSKCRLQRCGRLFSSLNTVGAQKLTGWFSPKLLCLGVWQQMHYCVLAGYLGRLMYATQTYSVAFWSGTVRVAAAGWRHEPGWINCFEPDSSLPGFVSAFHIWYIKKGKWAKCIRWHLVVIVRSFAGCQRCSALFFTFCICIVSGGKSCSWMMELLEESAIMISGAKRNHQCDCNWNHKHTHFLFCF